MVGKHTKTNSPPVTHLIRLALEYVVSNVDVPALVVRGRVLSVVPLT